MGYQIYYSSQVGRNQSQSSISKCENEDSRKNLKNKPKLQPSGAGMPLLETVKSNTLTQNNPYIFTLNLILIGAALAFMLYYVLQANVIAANSYQLKALADKANSLQEQNIALTSGVADDPSAITAFAVSNNMVVASDAARIFEKSTVAQR
jgi:hypothetical protein